MFNPFIILNPFVISVVLLPFFGFAAVYAALATRQLLLANKDNDKGRRQSAIKILALVLFILMGIVWIWYSLIFGTPR